MALRQIKATLTRIFTPTTDHYPDLAAVIALFEARVAALATAVFGATPTEVNQLNDVSAYQETIAAAGAINVTKVHTRLALVGAGAVTLAAPGATMLGQQKVIEMTADNGDVTLALTNVEGQSTGTTATFNDVNDALILVGGVSKWIVVKEFGISLA